MKIWAYVVLLTILTGFLTWGYNAVYDAGYDNASISCVSEKEDIANTYIDQLNDVRERERKAQEAADNIARAHYATIISEVEKNVELQKKLSESITTCVKDDAGNDIAYLSNDSIRVLNRCSQDSALPEATEKQGFIEKDKVAATDLAEYACYAIGKYNQCASEVNSAIKEQSIIGEHDGE